METFQLPILVWLSCWEYVNLLVACLLFFWIWIWKDGSISKPSELELKLYWAILRFTFECVALNLQEIHFLKNSIQILRKLQQFYVSHAPLFYDYLLFMMCVTQFKTTIFYFYPQFFFVSADERDLP
jgi:hypothetical protein